MNKKKKYFKELATLTKQAQKGHNKKLAKRQIGWSKTIAEIRSGWRGHK